MYTESKERQIQNILIHPDILPEQRVVLARFATDMEKNEGLALATRLNELSKISKLARKIKKPFKDMDRQDIEEFLYSLDMAPSSVDHCKIITKKFFKWFYKTDDKFPELVKWVKLRNHKKRKLPEDILTTTEVRSMIEATDNPRDRAIISVLYESACRLDELATLRQKSVQFDQYGARIMVNGKTGMRPIRLINSAPDLIVWMNNHPNKGPENNVFCNQRLPKKELGDQGIYYVVKTAAKKAGISKNVYPHILRHTRLTELAKELSDAELRVFSGWTDDSRMAGIYVHMSGGDVEKKMLANSGLIDKEEAQNEDNVLKPRACPRCKESNPSTARFCYKCGMALDMETAMKIENKGGGVALELLDLIQREPRIVDLLKQFSESSAKG